MSITGCIQFLRDHGVMLMAGGTALLVSTAAFASILRSPHHRQRVSELGLACTLAWLIFACIPAPRWMPGTHDSSERRAAEPVHFMEPIHSIDMTSATHVPIVANAPVDRTPLTRLIPSAVRSPLPVAPHINFAQQFAIAYLLGVSICGIWLVMAHVLLWRVLHRAIGAEPWLHDVIRDLEDESNLRRPVRVLISGDRIRPFSCGLWRPTIVLSAAMTHARNRSRLMQILRHELAHIKRRDAVGNALFNTAMSFLFFHPAYWFIRRQSFLAREVIADELASAATDRLSYAADLLAVAESCSANRHRPLAAVAMFAFTNDISRRITMLVQRRDALRTTLSNRLRAAWVGAGLFVVAMMSATVGVRPAIAAGEPLARAATKDPVSASAKDTTTQESHFDPLFFGGVQTGQSKSASDQPRTRPTANATTEAAGRNRELGAIMQRAQFKQLQGSHTEADFDIRRMQLEVDSAKLQLSKDLVDLKRKQMLYENHASTIGDVDEAQLIVNIDEIKVKTAELNLSRAMAARDSNTPAVTTKLGNSRGDLDIVSLANSYADAQGEIRLAEAKSKVAESDADTRGKVMAEAELKNATIKSQMLRRMVQVALKNAQAEFQRANQRQAAGISPSGELTDAKARVEVLEAILLEAPATAPK